MRWFVKILLLMLLGGVTFSCNVTRKLPDNSYLLTKNKIEVESPDSLKKSFRVPPAPLNRFVPKAQTPNKKIFGAHFFLWIYNLSNPEKNNGFQRFLRRIGEPPVLYDSTYTFRSVKDMKLYMASRGFYRATVSDTVIYKKQKANVNYYIKSGMPFTIDSVSYNFVDKVLEAPILGDTVQSLIKVGGTLDREVLEKERSRIARSLENMGYFQFSAANIRYTIDTTRGNYLAKVQVDVMPNTVGGEKVENKIYRIRNIYVNTNYNPSVLDTVNVDYDTMEYKGIYFKYVKGSRLNIAPRTITDAITIYPGYIYSREGIKFTSNKLSNLKFFKNVNILFKEIETSTDEFVTFVGSGNTKVLTSEGELDCTIECTPVLLHGYKVESEMTTNPNYFGIMASIGYVNKNIFRHAEIFDISGKVSYNFVRSKGKKNSYEFGAATSISFPKLVMPFNIARYNKLYNVNTRVELSFSSQRRPDYDRVLSSAAFGYTWSNGGRLNYTFKPISISLIKVPWIREDFLEEIDNPYLRSSYKSQLILGMFGSLGYSNATAGGFNSSTVRINAESSGNFLNLISWAANFKKHSDPEEDGNFFGDYYNVFGIRYSQYFRADASYIFRRQMGKHGALVWRLYAGGGVPYGNSLALPFERMFFAGGSSSMRGWQVRTLGPGNTPTPESGSYPNQVGNIRLETNLEQRFGIYGPIRGAVFLDCGNVWSNTKGSPEYARLGSDFLQQLALNTGVGVRLDFGFFLLRLDWGIQLRNPDWPKGERWIRSFNLKNTALQFGIGYPF